MPAIRFDNRLAPFSWLCVVTVLICIRHTVGHQATSSSSPVDICVVIRAYWGHGGASQQGLHNLITSLQRQSNPRYSMTQKPVYGLFATNMSSFVNVPRLSACTLLYTVHRTKSMPSIFCLQVGSYRHGTRQPAIPRLGSYLATVGR